LKNGGSDSDTSTIFDEVFEIPFVGMDSTSVYFYANATPFLWREYDKTCACMQHSYHFTQSYRMYAIGSDLYHLWDLAHAEIAEVNGVWSGEDVMIEDQELGDQFVEYGDGMMVSYEFDEDCEGTCDCCECPMFCPSVGVRIEIKKDAFFNPSVILHDREEWDMFDVV